MHIKNISTNTSLKGTILLGILSIMYTVGILYAYLTQTTEKITILNFCNWVKIAYNYMLTSSPDKPELAISLFIILPTLLYIGFIVAFIQRQQALKKFNSQLNVESIDLLKEKIKFNFTQPKYNFECSYDTIKSLKISIDTFLIDSGNVRKTIFREITLNFTILSDKDLYIKNTTMRPINFLYNIIDYTRKVQHFSYEFTGNGDIEDIKEKINDYLNKGLKQILPTQAEIACK